MNLIDAKEFHERKAKLYRLYGRQLPYYLSIPHGWLSTVEEMFAVLEMSIKPSSFRKMWFVELVKKGKIAKFYWIPRDKINRSDDCRAFELVRSYAYIASGKCEICGMPGKEIVTDGCHSILCSVHSHVS